MNKKFSSGNLLTWAHRSTNLYGCRIWDFSLFFLMASLLNLGMALANKAVFSLAMVGFYVPGILLGAPSLCSSQAEIADRESVSKRYIAATLNQISNGIAVSETIFLPSVVRSNMAITLTIDEFLTRETTSLVKGGNVLCSNCGKITS